MASPGGLFILIFFIIFASLSYEGYRWHVSTGESSLNDENAFRRGQNRSLTNMRSAQRTRTDAAIVKSWF